MVRKILIKVLLIAGICILLYPLVAKLIAMNNQTVAITKYVEEVENLSTETKEEIAEKTEEYNKSLYENKTFNASLGETEEKVSTVDFLGDLESIAYIYIPKISCTLPIYEGTTDTILNKGVGHLADTSLPSGGENTHSVLVAHTGLSKAVMFDNLDQLEIGDVFYINYMGNTLKYEVETIQTVLPDETESLRIEEGEDLVTLVTCTPKHINSHRLLVTGKRVSLDEEELNNVNDMLDSNLTSLKAFLNRICEIILIALFVILIILVILFILHLRKKYKQKHTS